MPIIILDDVKYCSSGGDANDILYNNENSGMEATNVQDAIDELNSKIDNNSSSVKAQSGAQNYTLAKFSNQVETIVFPEPFDEIPEVTVTMVRLNWTSSSYDDYFTCTVSTVTKTEFTVIMTSNIDSSTNVNIVWEAKTRDSNIGNTFSTDEIKTNDIWIDGKPIYRKVLNVSSLPNSTILPIYHEVSNMKEVVRLYGMAYYSGDNEGGGVTIPYTDCSNINYSIEIRANLTSILIITGTNRSSMRATIVIEYTKL